MHSYLTTVFTVNFGKVNISPSKLSPELKNKLYQKHIYSSNTKMKPLELIHLIVGLGKPLALHSIFKSLLALTVISFGSIAQLRGTVITIL
jgi:hypothetical protein